MKWQCPLSIFLQGAVTSHLKKLGSQCLAIVGSKLPSAISMGRTSAKGTSKKVTYRSIPKRLVNVPRQSMRHGFDTRILHSRSWLLASSLVWRLATDQVHMVELNNDNYTTAFSGVRSTKDLLRSGSSLSNLPLLGVPPENNGPIEYLPSYHIPALNLASSSGSPLSCSNKRGFNHNSDRLQFLNPTLNYQPVWAEGLRIPAQAQATLDSHSTYLETSTSAIQDTFSFDYGLPFPLNATQGGQPLQYYNPISLYQPSAPTTMAVHYREDSTHSTPWETSFDLPLYSNSNPSYQFYPQDDFYYRHN